MTPDRRLTYRSSFVYVLQLTYETTLEFDNLLDLYTLTVISRLRIVLCK